MPFNYHRTISPRVPSALATCSHVFVRVDAVRRPLCPPYEGPFKVLQREAKTFLIDRLGKEYRVSVDRLKPAFTLDVTPVVPVQPRPAPAPAVPVDAPDEESARPSDAVVTPTSSAAPILDPADWPLPTRYGRRPRPVERLVL